MYRIDKSYRLKAVRICFSGENGDLVALSPILQTLKNVICGGAIHCRTIHYRTIDFMESNNKNVADRVLAWMEPNIKAIGYREN